MNKILLILIILLSSCYSQKKATRQVLKAQAYYPELVAKNCADLFPVKEKTLRDIKYLPGKTITEFDTVKVDCDSAIAETIRFVKVPVEKTSFRVDTVYEKEYKEIEVTARIVELTAKYNQATIDKAIAETKLKTANKWLKIAIGVIVLMVGFKLARTYFKF